MPDRCIVSQVHIWHPIYTTGSRHITPLSLPTMTLTRILQPMVLLGTLLLAANVHGQGLAESVITSPDSAAPKHFGHVTCSRTLPGCTRCTMFYVKTRRAKAASSTATTAAATPETFGRFRKVFVCQQCRPGFTLTGSQDPNDPNPASCIPNGGGLRLV